MVGNFSRVDTLANPEKVTLLPEFRDLGFCPVAGNTGRIAGTAGDDILEGTSRDDILEGLAGQDVFIDSEGNMIIIEVDIRYCLRPRRQGYDSGMSFTPMPLELFMMPRT